MTSSSKSRALILGVVAALALAACGRDDERAATTSVEATTTAGSAATGSDGAVGTTPASPPATDAFPVTITHKYGEALIPEAPSRVISVGFTDQDAILALGVTPIAIRDWYGDQPYAVWPWAVDALGDAEPTVLPADAINFEQIASLQPDLILGVSSGMTHDEYAPG